MKDIFHREGLVSIAYERKYGEYSRPYGFAKLFLATADSDVVSLPDFKTLRFRIFTNATNLDRLPYEHDRWGRSRWVLMEMFIIWGDAVPGAGSMFLWT